MAAVESMVMKQLLGREVSNGAFPWPVFVQVADPWDGRDNLMNNLDFDDYSEYPRLSVCWMILAGKLNIPEKR